MKIEQLTRNIKNFEDKEEESKSKYQNRLEEVTTELKNLEDNYSELEEEFEKVRLELGDKERENVMLNNEIEELKNKGVLQNRTSFPATAL